ncbi:MULTISPECIES: hypothetical protein [Nocardiopsis]|uniref:hypothetical protein n=1 Tax=Nocardiopsis TaxID=2013 RepID=UPI000A4636D7|nr:hypothetical protein [Nocardiopsis alba]
MRCPRCQSSNVKDHTRDGEHLGSSCGDCSNTWVPAQSTTVFLDERRTLKNWRGRS